MQKRTLKAYCDGAYSDKLPEVASYGVLFENMEALSGTVEASGMRQIAGEITAVIAACEAASAAGVDLLRIFYDYEGLVLWLSGEWTAKNPLSISYKEAFSPKGENFIYKKSARPLEVRFVKVSREKNRADILAKRELKKLLG